MPDLIIRVELSTDRRQEGTLSLVDVRNPAAPKKLAGPFVALGKSDNKTAADHANKDRDPLKPYGDTPTGEYEIPRLVSTGGTTAYKASSYGGEGALVLSPTSGDAKTAAKNGRTGLLIHGGDPNKQGRLRPTHGCVRLSNADMKKLVAALNAVQNANGVRCDVLRVNATVGAVNDAESGEDVGDPPPRILEIILP